MGIHDSGWLAGQGSVTDLNETTILHKPNFASFPAASGMPNPCYMMDDSTGDVYKNESGTWVKKSRGAPADSQFAPTKKSDGTTDIVVSDTEFTTPTTVTASSNGVDSDFTDLYTTNTGWTTAAGTLVDVDVTTADKVTFNACPSNADHRVRKSLGLTLNDALWIAEFEANFTSLGVGAEAIPIFFSAGTGKFRSSQDALGIFVYNDAGTIKIYPAKNLAGTPAIGTPITISTSTLYYYRLERTSSTNLRVSIFSDSARTSHIAGSPSNYTIDTGIDALTHVQHSSDDGAGSANTVTGTLDSLYVNDNGTLINFVPSSMKDNKSSPTTLRHKTNSEVGPWVKADMNTAQELVGVAIHFHADTDITSFKIETDENDDANYRRRKTVPYNLITEGAWNIILFPRPAKLARRLKITGLDAEPKIISINELAVLVLPTDEMDRRHGHIDYTPTNSCTTLLGA